MRARLARLHGRAVAPIVVSAFLAIVIAATAVVGAEPSHLAPIPDSAFTPVTLPGPSAYPLAPARDPDLTQVRDPWVAAPPADRPQPSLPNANPVVIPKPTPTPKAAATSSTSHRISGAASWYCRAGISPCTSGYADGSGFSGYAAAGPRLRAAIGPDWRGKVVLVDGIRVKLIDWCQCYAGEPNEKLLDLYYDVFARTGSSVTIRW